MWVARNFDNSLNIFDGCPYLQIGAKKLVKTGREEIGHDVFIDIDKPIGDTLAPFWTENKTAYRHDGFGGYYDNYGGAKIHSSLFSFVTYENSPFNLETAEFLDNDKREKQIIRN